LCVFPVDFFWVEQKMGLVCSAEHRDRDIALATVRGLQDACYPPSADLPAAKRAVRMEVAGQSRDLTYHREGEMHLLKQADQVLFFSRNGTQITDLLEAYEFYVRQFHSWPEDFAIRNARPSVRVRVEEDAGVLKRSIEITGADWRYMRLMCSDSGKPGALET
jgi:hypothetical protein